MTPVSEQRASTKFHFPCLFLGIICMLLGSFVPIVFADGDGKANHWTATFIFSAMAAGFIRGIGYIPEHKIWRWLFSGWAGLITLILAIILWVMAR